VVLDETGHALLTDFGLSKEGVYDHVAAKSFCGSVAYLAPEMLKQTGHGKAVDWYLLGVLLYEMLVGVPPYYSLNREEIFRNIEGSHLTFPNYISNDAKSLLRGVIYLFSLIFFYFHFIVSIKNIVITKKPFSSLGLRKK